MSTNSSGSRSRKADGQPSPIPYNKCGEHEKEFQELFCIDHKKMVCVVCRRVHHTKCTKVMPITDACSNFAKNSAPVDLERQMQHLIKQCTSVRKERKWDLGELDRRKSEIVKTIVQYRQRIISKVEAIVKKVTDDIDQIYAIEETAIGNHVASLTEVIKDLEGKIADIEVAKKERSDVTMFIAVQNSIYRQRCTAAVLGQIHENARKLFMDFKLNAAVEHFTKKLNTLGELVVTTREYNVLPRPEKATLSVKVRSTNVEEFKLRKRVSQRGVARRSDKYVHEYQDTGTSWITGMAILKDSTIVMTDNNNNSIKLISPNNKMVKSLLLQKAPFDIAIISQMELVYTLPDVKQIQFLEIIGKSDIKNGPVLKTDFDCNGISVWETNRLAVSSISEKCVRMMDFKGVVQWTAIVDRLGQPLFEWPWYVKANSELKQIYVSDRRKNTITTLDMNGVVLNIRDVGGMGPRSIALDDVGNMYICHYMMDAVEIVSTDYRRDRKMILTKADGVTQPQCIAYDEQTGLLHVSVNNSDNLMVFQMS